ncbi:MAG: nicotinate-nucleotide diphosphorylase (carboxylating), partial [Candidatus Omnitrophica bacterium]|nr:nicotinate-nucleotide diphosphorylase (carboxylating) [Candidatus Omnitrophota bacterium]
MKKPYIQTLVRQALREDQAMRDVTTLALIPQRAMATARIIFKQTGIVCGQTVAKETFRQLDSGFRYKILVDDTEHVTGGRAVAVLRGKMRAVLSGERTALNFLGRMSGIATLTHRFVSAASPT